MYGKDTHVDTLTEALTPLQVLTEDELAACSGSGGHVVIHVVIPVSNDLDAAPSWVTSARTHGIQTGRIGMGCGVGTADRFRSGEERFRAS